MFPLGGSCRSQARGPAASCQVPISAILAAMRRIHLSRPASHPTRAAFLARRTVLRFAALLPWAVLGAGCGQKGSLYHPPESDEEDDGDEKTSAAPAAPDSRPG